MQGSSQRNNSWTIFISCIFSILIALLSWKNGHLIEDLFIQIVISFGFIYILINLSLFFYDKFEIWITLTGETKTQSLQPVELKLVQQESAMEFNGQVEPSLASGLPNEKAHQEIKQRMGLN